MRKIVVTVAPVCHVGKEIPAGCRNPLTPEDIADDVLRCATAGASMVHLHVRDLTGEQTFDLTQFSATLDRIAAKSDIIVQASTGGLSSLSLEERCVCLNEPRVEVASLNMGSVNFGESVYVNTLSEIRYWARRMRAARVVPEMEIFDLSMVETCSKLAGEGALDRPMHYNFCIGKGTASNLSDTPRNLLYMTSLMEPGGHWGLNNDLMQDFRMLACALAMGASVVRVGFEDSFYYAPGKLAATNAVLVEKLVELIRMMGLEPATPQEARQIFGLDKLRG
ncbi:MAG: 3-keto-5-aminohexanoate cleavage protein [Rikenellaceae bacterium]|jgi:3-keto-5-aminohexanoate cleavage enzyme|nr:3-keto-5-aminohexanoate cleavage protein [Rikenellaceae bacterium]